MGTGIIVLLLVILHFVIGAIGFYLIYLYSDNDDKYSDHGFFAGLFVLLWEILIPIILFLYPFYVLHNLAVKHSKKRKEIKELAESIYKDNQHGRTKLITKREAYKEAKQIINNSAQT